MMRVLLALVAALPLAAAQAPPPTAGEIMARVARNQERSQELRKAFVYHQSVLIRFRRMNRKLAREEMSDFTVTPTPEGFKKELTHFAGKYESKGQIVDYDKPHYEYKGVDIDGDMISELAEQCTNEKESRDGVAADMFPLTGKELPKYVFKLEGRETYRGRDAWRITFLPAKGGWEDDSGPWAGEVMVDAKAYQPLIVTTRLAKGFPVAVRILLGTNVKYIGFKISYDDFDGAWFPVTYGGEFELRALFFYKRLISLAMTNRGFERANVESRITFANK
jgi:hypothetical protein